VVGAIIKVPPLFVQMGGSVVVVLVDVDVLVLVDPTGGEVVVDVELVVDVLVVVLVDVLVLVDVDVVEVVLVLVVVGNPLICIICGQVSHLPSEVNLR
jgi:hypothetical protein